MSQTGADIWQDLAADSLANARAVAVLKAK